jgi:hypothetical protein
MEVSTKRALFDHLRQRAVGRANHHHVDLLGGIL